MIVDTSAVIAILRHEAEGQRFSEAIEADLWPRMSVMSYVESAVVVDSARRPVASRQLDELIPQGGIEVLPVTVERGRLAREAYRDFGRGSGHPARLNLGDCFSYALAKELGEPLLFKGLNFPGRRRRHCRDTLALIQSSGAAIRSRAMTGCEVRHVAARL